MGLLGLGNSIQILVDDLFEIHPLKIRFFGDDVDATNLDQNMQLNIFRIVQEQVNNILKHSKATRAVITLQKSDKEISLSIVDNGQGCDMAATKNGVGIRNILSRVELYKGTLRIESTPGGGFQLHVVLPINVDT